MTKITNAERMAKIETEIGNLKTGLEKHITEQREDFNKVFNKLDDLHESFAGKWVEKVSIGLIIGIIVTSISIIMG